MLSLRPLAERPREHGQSAEGEDNGKIDAAEFLAAAGTFLATVAAFASVEIIVLREIRTSPGR